MCIPAGCNGRHLLAFCMTSECVSVSWYIRCRWSVLPLDVHRVLASAVAHAHARHQAHALWVNNKRCAYSGKGGDDDYGLRMTLQILQVQSKQLNRTQTSLTTYFLTKVSFCNFDPTYTNVSILLLWMWALSSSIKHSHLSTIQAEYHTVPSSYSESTYKCSIHPWKPSSPSCSLCTGYKAGYSTWWVQSSSSWFVTPTNSNMRHEI